MSLNDNEPTNIQWLEHLLEVVTLLQSASNLAPVPYVNAGLTLIVHILKTIKTARQNQDDFRELVTSIVGIVTLVRDEIVNPKLQTNSSAFMAHCKAFNESLLDIITEINNKLRSLSGAKKYLLSGAIKDDLQKHQDRIREIRYNFMLWIIMQNRLVVHEMRDTMHKMRKDIIELPRTLGIPGESILFIDILDLNTQLPLSLCQSWESFLELVLLIHKNLNRPGLRYITSGDFDLTINDQVVSSTIFSSLVKRGSTVKMSVMLHRSKEQSDADSRRCPICSTLHIEPVALGSEIQCVNCGATFRVSRGILDLEVLRQQDTSDIAAVSASLSPSSGHRETRFTMDDEEVQYLRRFHIVLPPRQLRPPGGPSTCSRCKILKMKCQSERGGCRRCQSDGHLCAIHLRKRLVGFYSDPTSQEQQVFDFVPSSGSEVSDQHTLSNLSASESSGSTADFVSCVGSEGYDFSDLNSSSSRRSRRFRYCSSVGDTSTSDSVASYRRSYSIYAPRHNPVSPLASRVNEPTSPAVSFEIDKNTYEDHQLRVPAAIGAPELSSRLKGTTVYRLIIHSVPTTFSPSDDNDIETIIDRNKEIDKFNLREIRWINPKAAKEKDYSSIVIGISDQAAAQSIIEQGLRIEYSICPAVPFDENPELCYRCHRSGHKSFQCQKT